MIVLSLTEGINTMKFLKSNKLKSNTFLNNLGGVKSVDANFVSGKSTFETPDTFS